MQTDGHKYKRVGGGAKRRPKIYGNLPGIHKPENSMHKLQLGRVLGFDITVFKA